VVDYENVAICRTLALARTALAEKPTGRFMIRSRTRVVIAAQQTNVSPYDSVSCDSTISKYLFR
jgi:hypothetical protein